MTNNKLKIIAIVTMIIDHFGFYFSPLLSNETYFICRIIGRISMPIFTYLIVEGYFNTSNFKKYIKRLSIIAIITQISFFILDFVAKEKSYEISYIANILFSFILLLLTFKIFEYCIMNNKFRLKLLFVMYILIVFILYKYIAFDYGLYVLILGTLMYLSKVYIKNCCAYKIAIVLSIILISVMLEGVRKFAILSIIPIVLYNGSLGRKSNILKYAFYFVFPAQHILLYGMYILITK